MIKVMRIVTIIPQCLHPTSIYSVKDRKKCHSSTSTNKMSMYLLRISRSTSLYTQLCLEESLFRRTNDSWLIIRDGPSSSTTSNHLNEFTPLHFDGPDIYYNLNSSSPSAISYLYEPLNKKESSSPASSVRSEENNGNGNSNQNNNDDAISTRRKLPVTDLAKPVIVVGLSGNVDELVDVGKAKKDDIPLIRRFTGGGTVITDKDTMIVSIIFGSRNAFSKLPYAPNPFPRDIMSWTSKMIYQQAFDSLCGTDAGFRLRENDYVMLDGKKIGGNAQAISGERWLHHTSFLWDFDSKNMDYLKHPKKAPSYRSGREHRDFLCRIKDHVKDEKRNHPQSLTEEIIKQVSSYYNVIPITSNASYPFPSLTVESYAYRSRFLL